MQGNLNQVQLPEVLQFISMGKSTGLLTVRNPRSGEITLVISNGRIINSSALERRRRLGELLVQRGILKRSVLHEILSLQRTIDSDKRLGQILVDRDFVPETVVSEVLRLQLEEEIWNLFGLEEGEFRFQHAQEKDLGEALVEIDIDPLLLEGTRRQDEWRKITKIIPNDKMIPAVRNLSDDIYLEDKRKVSPHEWKVLAQVNGRFPISAVVNRCGMGRFEVYRLVSELIERGVLYLKSEEPESRSSTSVGIPGIHDRATVVTPLPGGPAPAPRPTGLFSLFGGSPRREERVEKVSFATPIGTLAHFINRMVDQFLVQKELRGSENDNRLIHAMWQDHLAQFTKADLIRVEKNQLVADRLEEFLRLFEFGEAAQDCYEDSMEALVQLLRSLHRVFLTRVGEKVAQRVVKELLEEFRGLVTQKYSPPGFKLDETVQKALASV